MIATHGSLAEAADALGRTPSAVSMMLKQFEDHVGSALFETARKSRLTPIGELILTEASREVAHFEWAGTPDYLPDSGNTSPRKLPVRLIRA